MATSSGRSREPVLGHRLLLPGHVPHQPDGVVLVDAPPTLGHNLLRAIQEVTRANGRPSEVTHLVYSHSHADHIGAACIFGKNVVRVGHTETNRLLRIDADPNRPAPTVTFDDHYVLQVGGERLKLAYHGPNHSPDNIFVYAPDYATLMVVDVFFPRLGTLQEPRRLTGHPRLDQGTRHRHGLPLADPRRRPPRSSRRPTPTATFKSSTSPTSWPAPAPPRPRSTPPPTTRSTGRPATPGPSSRRTSMPSPRQPASWPRSGICEGRHRSCDWGKPRHTSTPFVAEPSRLTTFSNGLGLPAPCDSRPSPVPPMR